MQDNTNVIFNNNINDNTTNQNQLSILKEQLCLDAEYQEKYFQFLKKGRVIGTFFKIFY